MSWLNELLEKRNSFLNNDLKSEIVLGLLCKIKVANGRIHKTKYKIFTALQENTTRRIYILLINIVTCHDIEEYMVGGMHSEKNNELAGKIIGHVKQIEEKVIKL